MKAGKKYLNEFTIDDLSDRKTGIVSFIAESEMEPADPDVFVLASQTADTLRYDLPIKITSSGSGAGLTYKDALYATIGEGIERYALGIIHPEDLVFGSFNELITGKIKPVSPDTWNLFSPDQKGLPFDAGFTNDTPIAWVVAQNISNKKEVLVPACLMYIPYYYHFRDRGEKIVSAAVSTGAACGSETIESMYKGICELIERDAFMIMWRNRLSMPRIIIDEESGLLNLFEEKFKRKGIDYYLFHTTLDMGIPSVFGVLVSTLSGKPAYMVGGSAHPSPRRAVLKTLIELVQGLKWMDFVGTSEFKAEPDFSNIRSFEDRMKLYSSNDMEQAFAFLLNHPEKVKLSEIKSMEKETMRDNLKDILSVLKEKSMDVVASELTPVEATDCGLVVTKVFIPSLVTMEGDFRAQYLGNERWREIPVMLGLLKEKTEAADINPFPHPYP